MSTVETVPPKKRVTAKRIADTEASPILLPQQIASQPCIPFECIDSDDEAHVVHGEGGTFWRSQKQAKPESSCRLGVAERRQPRIGDRYQAVIPEIGTPINLPVSMADAGKCLLDKHVVVEDPVNK